MAWFRNHYKCARCQQRWTDEWSCMCEDDCPHCGARHMSPVDSEDLTAFVEPSGHKFVVWWSPANAEHCPAYQIVATFHSRAEARAYIYGRTVGSEGNISANS